MEFQPVMKRCEEKKEDQPNHGNKRCLFEIPEEEIRKQAYGKGHRAINQNKDTGIFHAYESEIFKKAMQDKENR